MQVGSAIASWLERNQRARRRGWARAADLGGRWRVVQPCLVLQRSVADIHAIAYTCDTFYIYLDSTASLEIETYAHPTLICALKIGAGDDRL